MKKTTKAKLQQAVALIQEVEHDLMRELQETHGRLTPALRSTLAMEIGGIAAINRALESVG